MRTLYIKFISVYVLNRNHSYMGFDRIFSSNFICIGTRYNTFKLEVQKTVGVNNVEYLRLDFRFW